MGHSKFCYKVPFLSKKCSTEIKNHFNFHLMSKKGEGRLPISIRRNTFICYLNSAMQTAADLSYLSFT